MPCMNSPNMPIDLWVCEKRVRGKGFRLVAGIDEAGRGPLAGPVVAAAVILQDEMPECGINDSKKLTACKRESVYHDIYRHAVAIGIGIIDPMEIDRINILQASLKAMAFAMLNLNPTPDYLLIDGCFLVPADLPQEAIVRGDGISISIAAASIVAKVTRDRLMGRYADEYPEFDFAAHKGYSTQAHREAIRRFGCCPIHRKSFSGVFEFLTPQAEDDDDTSAAGVRPAGRIPCRKASPKPGI
jgi:ribonuclease HII